MKKNILILLIIVTPFLSNSQQMTSDSLSQVIVSKDIISKVERHEILVQRLEWTSPFFLVPTGIAIIGLGYTLFLYFSGIRRKAMAILESQEYRLKIDTEINNRVEQLAKAKEEKIKNKPIYILYLPGKDMRRLHKYLTDCDYTNVQSYTTEDQFDIAPNTLVIFNDEDGGFTDKIADYIKNNQQIKSKGHFFYYGSKRFYDPEIRMKNFANSDDTLAARVYESLSIN